MPCAQMRSLALAFLAGLASATASRRWHVGRFTLLASAALIHLLSRAGTLRRAIGLLAGGSAFGQSHL